MVFRGMGFFQKLLILVYFFEIRYTTRYVMLTSKKNFIRELTPIRLVHSTFTIEIKKLWTNNLQQAIHGIGIFAGEISGS